MLLSTRTLVLGIESHNFSLQMMEMGGMEELVAAHYKKIADEDAATKKAQVGQLYTYSIWLGC